MLPPESVAMAEPSSSAFPPRYVVIDMAETALGAMAPLELPWVGRAAADQLERTPARMSGRDLFPTSRRRLLGVPTSPPRITIQAPVNIHSPGGISKG